LKFDIFNDDHYGTDVELMLLMSLYKDVILVKKPYGVYRIHEWTVVMFKRTRKLLKMFSTYENVYRQPLELEFNETTAKKWLNRLKHIIIPVLQTT
jgi:hypothetical protein